MKNMPALILALLLVVALLAGCRSAFQDEATAPSESGPVQQEPTETEGMKETETEGLMLPLPQESLEFTFASGAGGWRTILTLNTDGSFTGVFRDSEMGITGDGYPKGSAYVCVFTGRFADLEQLDAHSYKMTLAEVKTEKAAGEEWIEDEIRYIAADPYGIEQGEQFIFYLPDTPVDAVSEEFLSWWPLRYDQAENPRDTLSCYGILNLSMGYGFFAGE